jgi:uncharacterized protein
MVARCRKRQGSSEYFPIANFDAKEPDVKTAMLEKLLDYLAESERVAIAYSGGVDSTFLLAMSVDALGADNVVAMTVQSPLTPPWETSFGNDFCRTRGIKHHVVDGSFILDDGRITANSPERCYYCKQKILTAMRRNILADSPLLTGTNSSDETDVRPGMRAEEEMRVETPLRRFRFTKEMIREHSRVYALPGFDRPPAACFATRIPYGEAITREKVQMIEQAETVLRQLGFTLVRARLIPPTTASLEVAAAEITRACDLREEIARDLATIGFTRVTVDLGGYRQGNLNPGHVSAQQRSR